MKGIKAGFTSNQGKGMLNAHSISSFNKDLSTFTKSFIKGHTKQNVIDDFVKTMKTKYNITVTVVQ